MPTEYRDVAGEPSATNGIIAVDPIAIDASGAEPSEQPRKRGRPKGSGTRTGSGAAVGKDKAEKTASLDLSSLTGMFVGIHALLAARTDCPELEITEQEGTQFMKAAQNVMRHYSVKTTQKTMDTIALIGVASSIYVPRAAAIRFRLAEEKRKKNEAREPNVVHFGGLGNYP